MANEPEQTLVKLLRKLQQEPSLPSKDIYKVLVVIRTKYMLESVLIEHNVVESLVQLLERPNSKVVDISLSILGNLMLHESARRQVKPHVRVLITVLNSLSEENILARTCRVLANIAQDSDIARILKNSNLLPVLVKILNEFKNPKAKASGVRALKVLGALEKRENLLSSNAIASISSSLITNDDEELLKSVCKCLVKFTNHGCDHFVAMQIQGEGQGFQRLVDCCSHQSRSVWEPALATLVNLSFIGSLRPNLGNAGAIWTFIVRANDQTNALSPGDYFRTISALCLYCHESVNRMKIRDAGGLRLFVSILQNGEKMVQNKIIKSLMQFAYDDLSLKVLQYVGLVPALVKLLQHHNDALFHKHSCEEFICDIHAEDSVVESIAAKKDSATLESNPHHLQDTEDQDQEDALDISEAAIDESEPQEERDQEQEKQYRINSPSFRQVRDEVEEFARIRSSLPGSSSWMSSDYSRVGLSPLHSRSPSASPRSSSPVPSYHTLSSAESSPMSDPGDRCPTYSPIETFSDDGEDDEPAALATPAILSPPAAKKSKVVYYQSIYSPPREMIRSDSTSSSTNKAVDIMTDDDSQISMILQILSRLAQSEVPHDSLCQLSVTKALVNYLCWTRKPSKRAGRILLRLSKNLSCLIPFVNQRTFSWLKPEIESRRPTLADSPCQECGELKVLSRELLQNFSLLAETGYAEGVFCHTLVKGDLEEKQCVSVGIPLLVRPRKLLINILINHEGFDVLLDIIEKGIKDLYEEAIYSLSILSGHVGIVAPDLTVTDEVNLNRCFYAQHTAPKDLKIVLDNGEHLEANKEALTQTSGVFEAMLSGQFAESSQAQVRIKETNHAPLLSLVHYLYGCRKCPGIAPASAKDLLDLLALTDKYLLPDFNRAVSSEVLRRCSQPDQVVSIYGESLVKEHPLSGTHESLNVCAISFILVGDICDSKRVEIFTQLLKSELKSDFLDDVSQTVRQKLLPLSK